MLRDPSKHIGAETPHVFRLDVVAGGGPSARDALATLIGRSELELVVENDTLTVSSAFSPRSAAVLRPLNVLDRAGVVVVGCEFIDLVSEVPLRKLRRTVESWKYGGEVARRRLEKLAGAQIIEQMLAGFEKADDRHKSDWVFALGRAAFNTPGSEQTLLAAASSMASSHAHSLISAVSDRARLCAMSGGSFHPGRESLEAVIQQGGYNAEVAAGILQAMPHPLPVEFVDVLIRACDGSERVAEASIYALAGARDDARVDSLLYEFLSDEQRPPSVRAAALSSLAARRGLDATDSFWRDWLSARSVNLRWAAEDVLARHGTADHAAIGAAQLAKIIRRKSSISYQPPRASAMLEFVARHSDRPEAARALEDVAARWDRLEPGLREWITDKLPSIVPSQATSGPLELDIGPEPPMRHAPPSLGQTDDGLISIEFWDTDMHEVREPFEELLRSEEGIVIVNSAREFIEVEPTYDSLPALVDRLWEQAHGD